MSNPERLPDGVEQIRQLGARVDALERTHRPYVALIKGSQSVPSGGSGTTVDWQIERSDKFGMWVSSNPTIIDLPKPGLYLVAVGMSWDNNSTGYRNCAVNGSATGFVQRQNAISGATTDMTAAGQLLEATGATMSVVLYQNSGVTMTPAVELFVAWFGY